MAGAVAPYERARTSCAAALGALRDLPASFHAAAAARFAASLDVAEVRAKGSSLANDANATGIDPSLGPLSSVDAEAALIVVMHALDFGGGWRLPLHAFHGKGAWLTVKPGVEALYAAAPELPAAWLASRTAVDVGALFGIGGDSAEARTLEPFVAQLTAVVNELGTAIGAASCATVAEWLMSRLAAADAAGTPPAAALVSDLVVTFPFTFDDRYQLRGGAQEVVLFKKAQLVVGELYHRFRAEDPRFAFRDGDCLTAFIDNVIVAVLRKVGVVAVTDELAAKIEAHTELPSGSEEEVALRAAAMVGVEEVARLRAADGLTPTELGNYLWGILGKTPEFRKFTRHVTRDNVFY